ncbi:MAG: GtrA family protein [Rhodoferax sp.]|uniref:GtrA family protein n=1 Tax=Rhodoferax sp. TaxID=50421 RepID=UPI0026294CFE|nr:GtrA family protein [Rhodoferax sp.]MDD5333703.1 GtrA family protein [Rhodoferax sp.]
MTPQLLRFGVVGGVGFLVDSGVLYALMACGLGFGSGRIFSFLSAVAVTWLLNRRFTFDAAQQTSLAREGMAYLAAMTLGGLLNLCTYAMIMVLLPYHPLLPVVGVAAGSLIGMVANFAGAKWWVYSPPMQAERWRLDWLDLLALTLLQLIFWVGILHDVDLPGLYMDAVNPEYLAARALNPALHNPVSMLPTAFVPLLGNLYHGVQNLYVSLLLFVALGLNLVALRIAQALFGAVTVGMVYAVTKRATGLRLPGLLAAAGLATDVAFVASFRTQFYIVLAGTAWLLCAVYCALPKPNAAPLQRRAMASGVFFGLAVYAYFVYLFFLPVVLACGLRNTRSWRTVAIWLLGFAIGMLPYVAGYLSLMVALGGLEPTWQWLTKTIADLAPLSSKLTVWESLSNSFRNARYALQNTGNELMIFSESPGALWPQIKVWALAACLLWVAAWRFKSRPDPAKATSPNSLSILTPGQLVWLPVCYFGISLLLGNRIWIHHFAVLLPLLYIMAALTLQSLLQKPASWLCPSYLGHGVLALTAAMAVANLHQQSDFFHRLEQTGGVGKMSNAINRMAEDARTSSMKIVYVFPEWGFFMPFSFLTANLRLYEVDISSATLQKHAQQKHEIRVAYWSADDDARYEKILRENGFQISGIISYLQRDQRPAFRVIQASP